MSEGLQSVAHDSASNPPPYRRWWVQYPITITDEVPWGTPLVPTTSENWTPYIASAELNSERPAWLADTAVLVSGAAGTLPSGSDQVFNLDTSWIYASSPESTVSQAVQGLVTDGSVPTVVNGVATVYHVRLYTYPYYPVTQDFWTFDLGRSPTGGYSDVWRYDPYDIPVDPGPPPCTDPCGCGGPGGPGGPPFVGFSAATGASSTSTNSATSTGGCSACGTGTGGLTYNSRAYGDSGFGPGWSDADEFPTLLGGSQNFAVRFGAEASVWFDEDGGSYTARYGAKQTLVHDTVNDLFIFTETDGTRYEFYDAVADAEDPAHPQYGLYRVVAPSGATIEVPQDEDSEENGWSDDGKIIRVLYKTTENGQAYQKREFSYWDNESAPGRRGHVNTITLYEYDTDISDFAEVRRMTYDYYGESESYGATGDLKTVVTQQWNGSTWTGDDTYYYRYYTGQYNSATNPGYAHSLKRVLLPNTYAKLCQDGYNPLTVSESTIANYTCFYYEYDADRRVNKEVVFGQSNNSEFTNTLSDNSDGYNNWKRQSVETLLNNSNGSVKSTNTVYTNYLGQTLLTDLYDAESDTHTLTYNRYDDDAHLILSADSASFVLSGGKYYDDSLPDLVNYASDSPYLSNTAGLFNVTTYYASTAGGIDEDTDGGVEGYTYQTAVAHGESAARLTVGATGGPILLSDYTYFARTVGDDTIYPTASYTTYSNEDGTGAATTEYAYTWYSGSFQYEELTTTLPVVTTAQNGSNTAATTKQWFDDHGKLAWSVNELGRVTYYEYSSLTGQLTKTIEDIDDATADSLSLTIPDGWTLPASSGVNATTEYQHDALGRITQTLGPAHLADISGTMTNVRTATWTVYLDAVHETRTAQGYATETSPGVWTTFAIVGPISITKTDRDGRTTDQIQTTYSGTVANLATATISQSDYTAWTTNQYSKTRLVSTRVYDDIPSSGTGTSGVNYEQTSYGYENYDQSGKMGREVIITDPSGTVQHVFLDARGNVLETWIGTDDVPASDYDSLSGINGFDFRYWVSQNPTATAGPAGTDMMLVASYSYDTDGNRTTSTDALSHTTEYAYDWRGRMVELTLPDPDGEGELESSVTECVYDNRNLMIERTDSLGDVTSYAYDDRARQYRLTLPDPDGEGELESPVTNYFYDDAGNLVSLVDSVGNTTSWVYDGLGQVIEETNELDATRYFEYDDASNLIQKTDRNQRVTEYVYDSIGRVSEENWLDSQQSVIWTISYVYNTAGRLESVGDDAAEYEFTYDDAGRVLTETQTIAGLTPVVVFSFQYDGEGKRTQLATTIGGTADLVMDYSYDYLDNVTRIEQHGVQGGCPSGG